MNQNLTIQDLRFTKPKMSRLINFEENEKHLKIKFIESGQKILGDKFKIQPDRRKLVTDLLKYFTGNEGKYDLNKGIYFYGDFGIGKTITMEVFRRFIADNFWMSKNGYHTTSIEQIIERYKTDNSLDYYGFNKNAKPFNLCINEFGKKVSEKIYGTEVDRLIESLFMIRYKLFQTNKVITHITSNYDPSELTLPAILKDRMNEMFNFIKVNGESLRK